jgi:hypothetical protein
MAKCLTPDELKSKAEEYTKVLSEAGYDTLPKQIRYFIEGGERTKQQLAHLAPYIKESYKEANPSIDSKTIDAFNIAKHVRDINKLQQEDGRIAKEPPHSTPISEPTKQWVDGTLGKVGLKDVAGMDMTTATKVHEAGKSWLDWAKTFAADIYQQGLELAKQDGAGIQRAIDGGAKGEKEILESVASKYIADISEHPLENIPKEMWTDKLFDAAKKHIENTTKAKIPDGFQYESLENLSGRIYNKLAQEGAADQLTREQTADIEGSTTLTGFEVNGTVPQNDLYKFIPHSEGVSTEPIFQVGFNQERGLRQGIGGAVQSAIEANNPNVTPREAIRSYLSTKLDSIIETTSSRREGNPNDKNFTLDLKPAKAILESNKFANDIEAMASQIVNEGRLDMRATKEDGEPVYSKEFRKMYDNMIEHYYQKAYLDSVKDDVLLDEKTKISKDQVKASGADISTFRKRILEKIGDHPSLLKLYDKFDKSVLGLTEHLNGWAKNFTGLNEGLLNKIVSGMTGADGSTGREATYKNSFDRAVKTLYESDWLRKGSAASNPNAKITELETRLIAGVPVTTSERLDIYAQGQRGNSAAMWYGKGDTDAKQAERTSIQETDPTKGEASQIIAPEKQGMTFVFKRQIEGRDAKEVLISYNDHKEMEAEFAPHLDQIKDTWVKGSNHLLTFVNRVFKLENGRELAVVAKDGGEEENQSGLPEGLQKVKVEKKEKGFYYPHTVAGDENIIMDKTNRNKWINDIASHKTYSPSENVKMSAGDFYETMQSYRDGNSKYAAWTIPMRNVDNFLRANEQLIKDLGLEHKTQWWVDYKKNVFNPQSEGVLGKTGKGMMANFILSKIGMNPFVSAEQMTAIPLAVNTLPAKYLFRAKSVIFSSMGKDIANYDMFTDWWGKDKKNVAIYDEMNERIPYALYRNTYGSSELQRFMQTSDSKSIDVLNKGLKKVFGSDRFQINRNDLLKNVQTPDKAIGAMYYTAAKMMANDEGLFDYGATMPKFRERVGDLYTQAITESQHSSDDGHRSMLATQNDVLSKSLSLFGTQKIAAFNGFHSRVIDYISDPSRENLNKMATQAMNVFVTNAALSATIATGRLALLGSAATLALHKPEDEWQGEFTKSLFNNIPAAAPVVDLVYSKYKSGVYGRDFSYAPFEIVTDGGTTLADGFHAITDGSKQKKAIKDFINFTTEAAGIPHYPIDIAKKTAGF